MKKYSSTDGGVMKRFYVFYPGKKFPSISITGIECSLECAHCNRHYLEGMKPAESPDKLRNLLLDLWKDGANGALISGGSDQNGGVPFKPFLQAIRDVKDQTDLIINLHTGLVSLGEAIQ